MSAGDLGGDGTVLAGALLASLPGSLIDGQNRIFLVRDVWSASDSTLIVPLDGSVRMQFQFQNQLP